MTIVKDGGSVVSFMHVRSSIKLLVNAVMAIREEPAVAFVG